MKQSVAIEKLNKWDKQERYVFRKRDLVYVFDESGKKLDQTLARLIKNRIFIKAAHGIYIYAFSKHIGAMTIELIARNLRRGEITFESLESALSQYGLISQLPIDRITLMTTGRSGEYHTPYGVIEFTHTKARPEDIMTNIISRDDHPLPIAKMEYAYSNLRSVGRNLNMIDMEELNDAY